MIRIIQHRKKCIGCNYCVEVAPENWYICSSDGKASLYNAQQKKEFFICTTTDDEYENNIKAMEICPVDIIKVERV